TLAGHHGRQPIAVERAPVLGDHDAALEAGPDALQEGAEGHDAAERRADHDHVPALGLDLAHGTLSSGTESAPTAAGVSSSTSRRSSWSFRSTRAARFSYTSR